MFQRKIQWTGGTGDNMTEAEIRAFDRKVTNDIQRERLKASLAKPGGTEAQNKALRRELRKHR